jgi:hypothetical protein
MENTLKNTLQDIIINTLTRHVILVKRRNSIYSDSQEFLVWSWAGINQISVQQASEELCYCGYEVPCGDAVLDRLSKQPYHILEHGFDQVFRDQVTQARKQRLFSYPVIVAIDFTDIEWYGKDLPFIVKGKARKGTDRFIRFATIGIVEDGKRFTLKILPVTPFSCKEKIVTELLGFVSQLVSVRVVLLDRGFYSHEVIQAIKNLGHRFVMPVKKYEQIKQLMKTVYKQGPQVYEMSKGTTFTLVVVKDDDSGKLLPYATNLKGLQSTVIHELYTHRFGIETQYRVKNQFLGRTCSKQYSVRYGFFILAVALYNLWVLLNILERGRQGLESGKIPIKVDWLKHLFRMIIYQQAPC